MEDGLAFRAPPAPKGERRRSSRSLRGSSPGPTAVRELTSVGDIPSAVHVPRGPCVTEIVVTR